MREGQFFVDRADVDDFAAGFGFHLVPDERLGDEEEALQIYVQDEIVIFFGDFPEIGAAFDTGVVDEDIDFAELRGGLFHEALAVGELGDVALDGGGFGAFVAETLDDGFRSGSVGEVADGDGGAFLDETLGDAQADALIASGDGDYFSF